MKNIFSTLLFSATVCALCLIVFPVVYLFSADASDGVRVAQIDKIQGAQGKFGIADGSNAAALKTSVNSALNVFLGLVGIVAVAFLIYGGVQYITAAGDDSKAEKAKKTIMYAIIGLIVIGLSVIIVNFVITAV